MEGSRRKGWEKMKINVAKQTLSLYFEKGLNLYETLQKVNYEIKRINYLLRNEQLFENRNDLKDYQKYAKERKKTLRKMILIINIELGFKDKKQRDKILEKHILKLRKIRLSQDKRLSNDRTK